MKPILRTAIEKAHYSQLVRYVSLVLEDARIRYRSVGFAVDTPYPILPKRYACLITLADGKRTFCVWEDPESFVDLLDSIETWLKSITEPYLIWD